MNLRQKKKKKIRRCTVRNKNSSNTLHDTVRMRRSHWATLSVLV